MAEGTFEEIQRTFREAPQRVAFFIGAGLSRPLFPTWKRLLEVMIEEARKSGRLRYDPTKLMDLLRRDEKYLDIADACVDALGNPGYRALLEREFDKEIREPDLPAAYQELLAAGPAVVLTTNYDRIPEVAGHGEYRTFTNRNPAEFLRAMQQGKKSVLKLHGDINDQETIVLGGADYRRIMAEAGIRKALEAVFSSRSVIFLGFGLSDPHLSLLLSVANELAKGMPVTHYAVMGTTDRFEIDALERNFGIRVASYEPSAPNHPEVLQFVTGLRGPVAPSVVAPPLDAAHFLEHISHVFRDRTGHQAHMIAHDAASGQSTAHVAVLSRGMTEYEVQRELVAIVDGIGLASTVVERIKIYLVRRSGPTLNIPEFNPVMLLCDVPAAEARRYSTREIDERDLWNSISFSVPEPVGVELGGAGRVEFPYLGV